MNRGHTPTSICQSEYLSGSTANECVYNFAGYFFADGQMTGIFILNELILALVGAVLFIVDYFLMRKSTSKIVPEKLI